MPLLGGPKASSSGSGQDGDEEAMQPPPATGKTDLLLRFFDSQFFDEWIALTYASPDSRNPRYHFLSLATPTISSIRSNVFPVCCSIELKLAQRGTGQLSASVPKFAWRQTQGWGVSAHQKASAVGDLKHNLSPRALQTTPLAPQLSSSAFKHLFSPLHPSKGTVQDGPS